MLFSAAEQGQGIVEYGFIILLVVLVVIALLSVIGPTIAGWFQIVTNAL